MCILVLLITRLTLKKSASTAKIVADFQIRVKALLHSHSQRKAAALLSAECKGIQRAAADSSKIA